MKRFMTLLRRQDGFTLVELMVVVAIIGILSAVAIPNFKKYQARSRTAEAKLQLAAVYTAQQAFYSDYTIYHACLRYMGYDPSEEAAQRYYSVGFGPTATADIQDGAYASAVNAGLNSGAYSAGTSATLNGVTVIQNGSGGCPDNAAGADSNVTFQGAKKIGNSIFAIADMGTYSNGLTISASRNTSAVVGSVGDQSNNDNMTFRAVAQGYVDADNVTPARASLFWINQEKQIANPQNGY